jgi:hypothetical protein
MRKTLLIAAAALAASIISSEAQVYSQNIVGYVNVPFVAGFTAVGNPLQNADGVNSATNVITGIPDFSYVYVWNGSGYNAYEVYQGQYYDSQGNGLVPTPNLPVGTGVFIQASAAFTNTFVGTVLVTNTAVGSITTNNFNLLSGFNFVNPLLPIGGGIISSLQMANIPDFSYIYVWNTGSQSYVGSESYQGTWYDVTGNFTVPEPTVAVGAAFYVDAANAFTWTVTYTNN